MTSLKVTASFSQKVRSLPIFTTGFLAKVMITSSETGVHVASPVTVIVSATDPAIKSALLGI